MVVGRLGQLGPLLEEPLDCCLGVPELVVVSRLLGLARALALGLAVVGAPLDLGDCVRVRRVRVDLGALGARRLVDGGVALVDGGVALALPARGTEAAVV